MTYEQLAEKMADLSRAIGAPDKYVYYQYPVGLAPEPPYVIYYITGRDDFKADNSNYVKIGELVIEIYTDKKNPAVEAAAEAWFEAQELAPEIEEQYIDSEQMQEVRYTTEVILEYGE